MCLIITSKYGILPDTETVLTGLRDNHDGWGIVYFQGDEMKVVKGTKTSSFMRHLKKAEGQPFMVHFRWATHGAKNIHNTHPFKIVDGLWMVHNGVLHGYTETHPHMSDTWHFANEIRPFFEEDPYALTDPAVLNLLDDCMGGYSKLAFLGMDKEIVHINKEAGYESDTLGIWYSNDNSLSRSAIDTLCAFDYQRATYVAPYKSFKGSCSATAWSKSNTSLGRFRESLDRFRESLDGYSDDFDRKITADNSSFRLSDDERWKREWDRWQAEKAEEDDLAFAAGLRFASVVKDETWKRDDETWEDYAARMDYMETGEIGMQSDGVLTLKAGSGGI